MAQGYYRFPTIQGSTIAFVCEEDIWTVPAQGGVAKRLTSGLAPSTSPLLSPDGKWLAFTGFEEGQPEIYLMPAVGGQPRRLTFLGASHCAPAAWSDTGLIFTSNAFQPFSDRIHLYRIYFISDHEGVGNIYSCLPDGSGLQRHTHHEKFYTRNTRSDGHSIVYHAGADIYRYDLSTDTQKKVLIKFHSPQNHRNRRFSRPALTWKITACTPKVMPWHARPVVASSPFPTGKVLSRSSGSWKILAALRSVIACLIG